MASRQRSTNHPTHPMLTSAHRTAATSSAGHARRPRTRACRRSRNCTRRLTLATCAAALALGLTFSPEIASAIQPATWQHSTEADFEPGENEDTVVTNLGDVKLAISTKEAGEMTDEVTVVHDMQAIGDTIYIAAGPSGRVLQLQGGEITERAAVDSGQIFSLDVSSDGRLLVAVSAETSRIDVLTDEGLETLVELEDTRYIWDILVEEQTLDLATGTEGRILRVELGEDEPTVSEVFDATQANILSLGRDDRGRIYAGTDTDGLVYRLTPDGAGEFDVFVLYDAAEPEIGALLVRPDGTVFAGTADAEQARPGRLGEAAAEEAGRPSEGAPAEPGAADDPDAPEPGDIPSVAPEPEPIGGEGEEQIDGGADAENGAEDDAAPAETDEPQLPVDTAPTPEPQAVDAFSSRVPAAMMDRARPDVLQADDAPDPGDGADAADGEDGDAAADTGEADAPETITANQRDQLREVIRSRLMEARRSGELQVQPGQRRTATRTQAVSRATPGARPSRPSGQQRQGNAIYRIDPDGFVAEIFRESVMILNIIDDEDRLLVATGNEGQIFSVNPQAQETSIVADLEPSQISAMAMVGGAAGDIGHILLGTANPARLVRLQRGFAEEGTYTSPVLDAEQVSLFGTLQIMVTTMPGTQVNVQTRSGNVGDPERAAWSMWTDPTTIEHDADRDALEPQQIRVETPPARFLQYRLTLEGNGDETPAVGRVRITYVTPNLRPSISSVQTAYVGGPAANQGAAARRSSGGSSGQAAEPQPPTGVNITWEANDPNGDTLRYELQYATSNDNWITLEEDLQQNNFEWKTRLVPDGRYRVRAIASDAADNPGDMAMTASRVSDPLLVDNTAPTVEQLNRRGVDEGILVTGEARDALSSIRGIHYTVDSAKTWSPVLPDDLIFDSTSESFRFTLTGLSPGAHTLTIRVTDELGNAHYEALHLRAGDQR